MKKEYMEQDKQLMKKIKSQLYNKYGDSITNYKKQKINYLIYSKSSNFYINYQECTAYDDYDEYHKRIYYKWEIPIKLNDLFEYYSNYLTFFCRPIITNFYYNTLLHYCDDKKADIFYKNNFKEKDNDNDNDDKSHSKEDNDKKEKIKEKFEKVNILIFDKETKNIIDNSSNILSSIDRIKDEDQNMSYTKKIKINDKNYIVLEKNDDNLLDFIKEINFNNKIKNNNLNQNKKNETPLINHSSLLKQKIYQKYSSGNIKTIINYIDKEIGRKTDLLKDKIKYIKLIKNKKDQSGNKDNISKEKGTDNNLSKNKKIKKLKINFF